MTGLSEESLRYCIKACDLAPNVSYHKLENIDARKGAIEIGDCF